MNGCSLLWTSYRMTTQSSVAGRLGVTGAGGVGCSLEPGLSVMEAASRSVSGLKPGMFLANSS